ncbi:hypothetical protein V6N13_059014 [Hibiscus sabdariffa]|uniref:26S proteasome non-ATPase regulatory subunit 1/RPN2 N-terminal domain-containing protein n=1 Tax=Hibiscus sabdariffa TaxID=183260 RepID=A0ABR2GG69_9ROSI
MIHCLILLEFTLLFYVYEDSDYVYTLLAKTIDEYDVLWFKAVKTSDEATTVDLRLEAIVERILNQCIMDGKYKQAMAIAIECWRLDKLEEAITRKRIEPGDTKTV